MFRITILTICITFITKSNLIASVDVNSSPNSSPSSLPTVQQPLLLSAYQEHDKFKQYQNLKGARVNLTYYRHVEDVAGIEFETMKVVRIKRS